jgi:hypothetical protein
VFDSTYKRAVTVTSVDRKQWSKPSGGEVKSPGIDGWGRAAVYAKRERVWRFLASEDLFSYH